MCLRLIAAALIVLGLLSTACATETMRKVETLDSTADTIKFVYSRQVEIEEQKEWERGIIECRLDEDVLRDCRRVHVEYQ